MFSLGSHFLSVNNPSMVHSLVDSFFEGKKALVKERLMDSVRVIVDGLFEEMVGQVKEMLLPPKEESSGGDHQMKKKQERNSSVKVNSPKKSPTKQNGHPCKPSSPKRPALVFAVKSKPSGPSTSGPSTSAAVAAVPKRVLISSENNNSSTLSPSKQSYKKVKFSSSEHYLDVKFEGEDEAAAKEHSFENPVSLKTTQDESNDDGDDDHLSNSIENPQNEKPENSQPKQQQQQQRQQTVISGQKKSVVVTCPEEGCGKQLQSGNLKRHLKSHAKLKPYGCTYEQCSYETEHRHDALRHIKSVHLAKKKKKKSENGENEDEEEEEDPVTYLSVKQDLL